MSFGGHLFGNERVHFCMMLIISLPSTSILHFGQIISAHPGVTHKLGVVNTVFSTRSTGSCKCIHSMKREYTCAFVCDVPSVLHSGGWLGG